MSWRLAYALYCLAVLGLFGYGHLYGRSLSDDLSGQSSGRSSGSGSSGSGFFYTGTSAGSHK